ncbi:MAG: AEC family transporter [Clostridiales bacterium]|nr:AEC family transporter [Clostridiales bacterium]
MLLIFSKMLTVGLLLGVGVLLFRLGIVSEKGSKELSAMIVQLCSPAMIVVSALEDTSAFTLEKLGVTALVCAVIYGTFLAVGELMPILTKAPREERTSYHMLSLFGNVGFVGIPVTLSILGASAMLYVVIFNVMYSLLFYSYGYHAVSKAVGKPVPFRLSSLFNPGLVACYIAIALYLLPISVPDFLGDTLSYVGNCTTFLSLVVLGVSLATTSLKKVLTNARIYLFLAVRMLALPVLLALVLGRLLPDSMMVSALVLLAAMPAGNMPVMLAHQYDMDTDTLTSGVITSTLLCLVTIPIVSFFFPA